MRKFLIDTFDLSDQIGEFEHLFDFYLGGLKGILTDFLSLHLETRPLEDNEEQERQFFDNVLEQYQHSVQYRLNAEDPMGTVADSAVMLACYVICEVTRMMVATHEHVLRRSVLTPRTMSLAPGYLLVPQLG